METTKGWKVRRESDGKRVGRGWKVSRESDVRLRRVGAVGLGHMARQDFARGMHRHGTQYVGSVTVHCYRIPSQGTVSGHGKNSGAGEADGAVVQGLGTSLPGTAWTWHCDIRGAHGDNFGDQCGLAVRKKPRFTHVVANLGGDVRGKRFSTHAMERNVARLDRAGVETTKGWKVRRESDDK